MGACCATAGSGQRYKILVISVYPNEGRGAGGEGGKGADPQLEGLLHLEGLLGGGGTTNKNKKKKKKKKSKKKRRRNLNGDIISDSDDDGGDYGGDALNVQNNAPPAAIASNAFDAMVIVPDREALSRLKAYVSANPHRTNAVCRRLQRLIERHLKKGWERHVGVGLAILRALVEEAAGGGGGGGVDDTVIGGGSGRGGGGVRFAASAPLGSASAAADDAFEYYGGAEGLPANAGTNGNGRRGQQPQQVSPSSPSSGLPPLYSHPLPPPAHALHHHHSAASAPSAAADGIDCYVPFAIAVASLLLREAGRLSAVASLLQLSEEADAAMAARAQRRAAVAAATVAAAVSGSSAAKERRRGRGGGGEVTESDGFTFVGIGGATSEAGGSSGRYAGDGGFAFGGDGGGALSPPIGRGLSNNNGGLQQRQQLIMLDACTSSTSSGGTASSSSSSSSAGSRDSGGEEAEGGAAPQLPPHALAAPTMPMTKARLRSQQNTGRSLQYEKGKRRRLREEKRQAKKQRREEEARRRRAEAMAAEGYGSSDDEGEGVGGKNAKNGGGAVAVDGAAVTTMVIGGGGGSGDYDGGAYGGGVAEPKVRAPSYASLVAHNKRLLKALRALLLITGSRVSAAHSKHEIMYDPRIRAEAITEFNSLALGYRVGAADLAAYVLSLLSYRGSVSDQTRRLLTASADSLLRPMLRLVVYGIGTSDAVALHHRFAAAVVVGNFAAALQSRLSYVSWEALPSLLSGFLHATTPQAMAALAASVEQQWRTEQRRFEAVERRLFQQQQQQQAQGRGGWQQQRQQEKQQSGGSANNRRGGGGSAPAAASGGDADFLSLALISPSRLVFSLDPIGGGVGGGGEGGRRSGRGRAQLPSLPSPSAATPSPTGATAEGFNTVNVCSAAYHFAFTASTVFLDVPTECLTSAVLGGPQRGGVGAGAASSSTNSVQNIFSFGGGGGGSFYGAGAVSGTSINSNSYNSAGGGHHGGSGTDIDLLMLRAEAAALFQLGHSCLNNFTRRYCRALSQYCTARSAWTFRPLFAANVFRVTALAFQNRPEQIGFVVCRFLCEEALPEVSGVGGLSSFVGSSSSGGGHFAGSGSSRRAQMRPVSVDRAALSGVLMAIRATIAHVPMVGFRPRSVFELIRRLLGRSVLYSAVAGAADPQHHEEGAFGSASSNVSGGGGGRGEGWGWRGGPTLASPAPTYSSPSAAAAAAPFEELMLLLRTLIRSLEGIGSSGSGSLAFFAAELRSGGASGRLHMRGNGGDIVAASATRFGFGGARVLSMGGAYAGGHGLAPVSGGMSAMFGTPTRVSGGGGALQASPPSFYLQQQRNSNSFRLQSEGSGSVRSPQGNMRRAASAGAGGGGGGSSAYFGPLLLSSPRTTNASSSDVFGNGSGVYVTSSGNNFTTTSPLSSRGGGGGGRHLPTATAAGGAPNGMGMMGTASSSFPPPPPPPPPPVFLRVPPHPLLPNIGADARLRAALCPNLHNNATLRFFCESLLERAERLAVAIAAAAAVTAVSKAVAACGGGGGAAATTCAVSNAAATAVSRSNAGEIGHRLDADAPAPLLVPSSSGAKSGSVANEGEKETENSATKASKARRAAAAAAAAANAPAAPRTALCGVIEALGELAPMMRRYAAVQSLEREAVAAAALRAREWRRQAEAHRRAMAEKGGGRRGAGADSGSSSHHRQHHYRQQHRRTRSEGASANEGRQQQQQRRASSAVPLSRYNTASTAPSSTANHRHSQHDFGHAKSSDGNNTKQMSIFDDMDGALERRAAAALSAATPHTDRFSERLLALLAPIIISYGSWTGFGAVAAAVEAEAEACRPSPSPLSFPTAEAAAAAEPAVTAAGRGLSVVPPVGNHRSTSFSSSSVFSPDSPAYPPPDGVLWDTAMRTLAAFLRPSPSEELYANPLAAARRAEDAAERRRQTAACAAVVGDEAQMRMAVAAAEAHQQQQSNEAGVEGLPKNGGGGSAAIPPALSGVFPPNPHSQPHSNAYSALASSDPLSTPPPSPATLSVLCPPRTHAQRFLMSPRDHQLVLELIEALLTLNSRQRVVLRGAAAQHSNTSDTMNAANFGSAFPAFPATSSLPFPFSSSFSAATTAIPSVPPLVEPLLCSLAASSPAVLSVVNSIADRHTPRTLAAAGSLAAAYVDLVRDEALPFLAPFLFHVQSMASESTHCLYRRRPPPTVRRPSSAGAAASRALQATDADVDQHHQQKRDGQSLRTAVGSSPPPAPPVEGAASGGGLGVVGVGVALAAAVVAAPTAAPQSLRTMISPSPPPQPPTAVGADETTAQGGRQAQALSGGEEDDGMEDVSEATVADSEGNADEGVAEALLARGLHPPGSTSALCHCLQHVVVALFHRIGVVLGGSGGDGDDGGGNSNSAQANRGQQKPRRRGGRGDVFDGSADDDDDDGESGYGGGGGFGPTAALAAPKSLTHYAFAILRARERSSPCEFGRWYRPRIGSAPNAYMYSSSSGVATTEGEGAIAPRDCGLEPVSEFEDEVLSRAVGNDVSTLLSEAVVARLLLRLAGVSQSPLSAAACALMAMGAAGDGLVASSAAPSLAIPASASSRISAGKPPQQQQQQQQQQTQQTPSPYLAAVTPNPSTITDPPEALAEFARLCSGSLPFAYAPFFAPFCDGLFVRGGVDDDDDDGAGGKRRRGPTSPLSATSAGEAAGDDDAFAYTYRRPTTNAAKAMTTDRAHATLSSPPSPPFFAAHTRAAVLSSQHFAAQRLSDRPLLMAVKLLLAPPRSGWLGTDVPSTGGVQQHVGVAAAAAAAGHGRGFSGNTEGNSFAGDSYSPQSDVNDDSFFRLGESFPRPRPKDMAGFDCSPPSVANAKSRTAGGPSPLAAPRTRLTAGALQRAAKLLEQGEEGGPSPPPLPRPPTLTAAAAAVGFGAPADRTSVASRLTASEADAADEWSSNGGTAPPEGEDVHVGGAATPAKPQLMGGGRGFVSAIAGFFSGGAMSVTSSAKAKPAAPPPKSLGAASTDGVTAVNAEGGISKSNGNKANMCNPLSRFLDPMVPASDAKREEEAGGALGSENFRTPPRNRPSPSSLCGFVVRRSCGAHRSRYAAMRSLLMRDPFGDGLVDASVDGARASGAGNGVTDTCSSNKMKVRVDISVPALGPLFVIGGRQWWAYHAATLCAYPSSLPPAPSPFSPPAPLAFASASGAAVSPNSVPLQPLTTHAALSPSYANEGEGGAAAEGVFSSQQQHQPDFHTSILLDVLGQLLLLSEPDATPVREGVGHLMLASEAAAAAVSEAKAKAKAAAVATPSNDGAEGSPEENASDGGIGCGAPLSAEEGETPPTSISYLSSSSVPAAVPDARGEAGAQSSSSSSSSLVDYASSSSSSSFVSDTDEDDGVFGDDGVAGDPLDFACIPTSLSASSSTRRSSNQQHRRLSQKGGATYAYLRGWGAAGGGRAAAHAVSVRQPMGGSAVVYNPVGRFSRAVAALRIVGVSGGGGWPLPPAAPPLPRCSYRGGGNGSAAAPSPPRHRYGGSAAATAATKALAAGDNSNSDCGGGSGSVRLFCFDTYAEAFERPQARTAARRRGQQGLRVVHLLATLSATTTESMGHLGLGLGLGCGDAVGGAAAVGGALGDCGELALFAAAAAGGGNAAGGQSSVGFAPNSEAAFAIAFGSDPSLLSGIGGGGGGFENHFLSLAGPPAHRPVRMVTAVISAVRRRALLRRPPSLTTHRERRVVVRTRADGSEVTADPTALSTSSASPAALLLGGAGGGGGGGHVGGGVAFSGADGRHSIRISGRAASPRANSSRAAAAAAAAGGGGGAATSSSSSPSAVAARMVLAALASRHGRLFFAPVVEGGGGALSLHLSIREVAMRGAGQHASLVGGGSSGGGLSLFLGSSDGGAAMAFVSPRALRRLGYGYDHHRYAAAAAAAAAAAVRQGYRQVPSYPLLHGPSSYGPSSSSANGAAAGVDGSSASSTAAAAAAVSEGKSDATATVFSRLRSAAFFSADPLLLFDSLCANAALSAAELLSAGGADGGSSGGVGGGAGGGGGGASICALAAAVDGGPIAFAAAAASSASSPIGSFFPHHAHTQHHHNNTMYGGDGSPLMPASTVAGNNSRRRGRGGRERGRSALDPASPLGAGASSPYFFGGGGGGGSSAYGGGGLNASVVGSTNRPLCLSDLAALQRISDTVPMPSAAYTPLSLLGGGAASPEVVGGVPPHLQSQRGGDAAAAAASSRGDGDAPRSYGSSGGGGGGAFGSFGGDLSLSQSHSQLSRSGGGEKAHLYSSSAMPPSAISVRSSASLPSRQATATAAAAAASASSPATSQGKGQGQGKTPLTPAQRARAAFRHNAVIPSSSSAHQQQQQPYGGRVHHSTAGRYGGAATAAAQQQQQQQQQSPHLLNAFSPPLSGGSGPLSASFSPPQQQQQQQQQQQSSDGLFLRPSSVPHVGGGGGGGGGGGSSFLSASGPIGGGAHSFREQQLLAADGGVGGIDGAMRQPSSLLMPSRLASVSSIGAGSVGGGGGGQRQSLPAFTVSGVGFGRSPSELAGSGGGGATLWT